MPASVQGFLADIDSDMLLELEARISEAADHPPPPLLGVDSNMLLGLEAPISQSGMVPSPSTTDASQYVGNLLIAIGELSGMPLNAELIKKARMISNRLVTSQNEHIRGATHQLLINFLF